MELNNTVVSKLTKKPLGLPLMYDAWAGCLHWAIGNDDIRRRFQKDTGIDLNVLAGRSRMEILVDEATGRDSEIIAKFCDWVTENVWGTK